MSAVRDKSEELSSEWYQVKLGDVLQVIRGASPRPKGDPRYFGGDIPWIKISDITKEKGKYISTTKDHVTEKGAQKSRYLKAGTLILSNSGTVCVPKILAVDGCIHDGFVAFPELPNEFDILYLYYFFDKIRPQIINENRQGITQVNLNTTIVKNIDLPVAPENEQKRIVAEIEKQFSRLDEAVDNLKRVKANLKRYKASVLKAAVEGKLTEEWRKKHPDVEPADKLLQRILAERRKKWEEAELAKMKAKGKKPNDDKWKKKYKVPAKPDIDDLPPLQNSWVWVSMDQLSIKITDGEHISPKTKGKGMPLLSAKDVREKGVIFNDAKYVSLKDGDKFRNRCNPERNDILVVSRGATIGRTCIVDTDRNFCLMGSVILIKLFKNINTGYILMSLKSSPIHKKILGISGATAQQAIYIRDIRKLPIPLPPIREQQAIYNECDGALTIANEIDTVVDTNIKRIERLRQSLLKKAFSGKLVSENKSQDN